MPNVALKTSREVSRFLRQRRQRLSLSLRDVSARLAETGERFPPSTLARIEHGKLDPGVWRLHQLLKLYDVPPHLVADLIELEEQSVEQPPAGDLETLFRDGFEYWKQGNTAKGLAYLFAVRQYVPRTPEALRLRQEATLALAVCAQNLGKFELAHQIVDDLLREPPDPSLRINVLVFAASVWRGIGSLDAAMAFQDRAESLLSPEDHKRRAWVLHEKARLLYFAGRPAEATETISRAIESYRTLGDLYGEGKARLARVDFVTREGKLEQAAEEARDVVEFARKHAHAKVELSARIKLGALEVALGSAQRGLDTLLEALGHAVSLRNHHGQFLGHYHLWKTYARLGECERARIELESAGYFVRFVDEVSPEADEVRRLTDPGGGHAKTRRERPPKRRP